MRAHAHLAAGHLVPSRTEVRSEGARSLLLSSGVVRTVREMESQVALVLYVLALVAVVVSVDVLFFRNRLWERLMVNVGIVLVFWAFYLRFVKRP
jgi:hypothetical protein